MSDSLRGIRLFVAAYEERSFTAAAKRENATQSGVSQHIRKLETAAGAQLFSRGTCSVTPTPAGDGYYQKCIEVLRVYDAANEALRSYSSGFEGEIKVGLMPSLTRRALAPALSDFIARNPNVVVRVSEAESGQLIHQVQAGELDFAIVPAFDCPPGLKITRFLRTPEVLVSARESRLQPLDPVKLAALGPLKFILPTRQNKRHQTIETYFATTGVQVDRVIELDAVLGTLGMVSCSDWVTIMPGVMFTPLNQQDRFTANPLVDPPLHLDLVFIEPARKAMPEAAAAFRAAMRAEAMRINAIWERPETA